MAEKKFFVDVNLQGNNINNLKADTLDITSNLASANTKRIVYWSGQYYYSDGTSWIALGNTESLPAGGATGDILAKASGTNYDVEWISNYTSTVQHEVKAGVALTKGQAVYVSSANGTNMIVSKASNASESTSSKTMGLVASSAALNGIIFVITEGLLTGTGGAPLNTSTANAGDPVWLGTDGNPIFGLANKPVAPAHLVFLGIVTRSSATVGEIFIKVQNGFELGELHDVDALNASNNDGLFYNTTTSLWEHKSIATALGYTPENVANKSTSTSLGTSDTLYPTQNAVKVYADNLLGNANALVYKGTIDCSTNPDYPTADAGWMYIASIAGKIGGASGTDVEVGDMIICNTDGTVSGNQATVGQYWNVIQKNIVGAVTGPASSVSNNVVFFDGVTGKIIKDSGLTLSGTNTGDETTATIKTKLGTASSSTDGYLTSTDWSTFNGKQNELSGTGFVKISGTTISYDNSTYLTANQNITLSGDITGSGSTSISTSISASTVIGKLITGFVSGAGTVTAADSILTAVNKLDGNIGTKQATLVSGTNIKTVAGVNLLGSGDIGTIGDTYISSATTWNSKQAGSTILTNVSALSYASGTPFIKMTGVNTFALDTNTYLTGNQTLTLSGDVTGSGATGITTSISATTVTGKLITGFVSGAGTVSATDTILQAINKLDGNVASKASATPSVQSVTSASTVTPVSTNDIVTITAQAVGLTLANPTGTFVEGQSLMIRIKDNGTARAITFGANYRAIGITLPSTTVISKTMYLGIIYNSTDAKFDIVGLNQQA